MLFGPHLSSHEILQFVSCIARPQMQPFFVGYLNSERNSLTLDLGPSLSRRYSIFFFMLCKVVRPLDNLRAKKNRSG